MKKEFSFYEFVGIIVPSVTLLFFCELLFELSSGKSIVDFSKIGDTLIFVIIAYGIGHLLQSIGNMYEWIIWKIYGGMPSAWLTNESRFKQTLFDTEQNKKIKQMLFLRFGETENKDYGRDTYNYLVIKNITGRTDIFNGNYSLFRGLAVAFLILGCIALNLFGWKYSLIPIALYILATMRMIRFAKLYAKEIYRTFLNLQIEP